MSLCHRSRCLLPALAVLLIGPAWGAARTPRDVAESNALVMTAEIALQRSNCGRAADNYAAAVQRLDDAKLATRASAVALDCGQFSDAERAALRWQQLAPADPAALLAGVRADLGLYKIDAARAAFERWLASPASARGDAIASEISQLAQQAGVSPTFAMLRDLRDRPLQGASAQLALAALAFDDWNYRAALESAQHAFASGAEKGAAQALIARAQAGLGNADAALSAAKAAREAAPADQSFVTVDALLLLGRDADARTALESLEDSASLRNMARRRLALLAFTRGDYTEADRLFTQLLSDRDSSAVAVFYLAALAERRGDMNTALRGYQLLDGTAFDGAARVRAAEILYQQNEHEQALQILSAAEDADIPSRLESEIEQAQLLSDRGAASEALARLDDTLARFPEHPDLSYQKSILLERAGRTDAAIGQLESLYRARPGDSAIGNALGYILADHNRDLSRAERLISAALRVEPDNPAILDSLGWLQYRRGAARAALPLLARAYLLDQDGDIGAHWGEVLWSMGEKAQARDVWTRALAVDPDNAALKAAMQRSGMPPLPLPGTGTAI